MSFSVVLKVSFTVSFWNVFFIILIICCYSYKMVIVSGLNLFESYLFVLTAYIFNLYAFRLINICCLYSDFDNFKFVLE